MSNEIHVIKTADRVEIDHDKIQELLRTYIEMGTGRKVNGEVYITDERRGTNREWKAHATLQEEEK